MKGLDDDKLQIGDIILTTENHLTSKAIRFATNSDISHAMLYVARGSVIDSTPEGVHARSTGRMFFDDDCAVHVRRMRRALTTAQTDVIVRYARAHIGTRYSVPDAVRSKVGTSRAPTRQQFCSRLTAQAYSAADIKLVATPDFCTPDDVKNSSLLESIEDAVISISEAHVESIERHFDTTVHMRETTNRLLSMARNASPTIESLNDINAYLISHPAEDAAIGQLYEQSGYLTAWKVQFESERWQYELGLLTAMPGSNAEKRDYCLGVLRDHGEMLVRRDENRAGYFILFDQHRLNTFSRLMAMYEHLVTLQIARRYVALQWLARFAPEDLPAGAEGAASLRPHTEEWFAVLSRQNPQQASVVRTVLEAVGSTEVCTFCGDDPAPDYRLIEAGAPDSVMTVKLCDDCRRIRKDHHGETFVPLTQAGSE